MSDYILVKIVDVTISKALMAVFMLPQSGWHIALHLSVRPSVRTSVRPSVPKFCERNSSLTGLQNLFKLTGMKGL